MQIYCQLTVKYAFRDKTCNLNIAACTANCAEEIYFKEKCLNVLPHIMYVCTLLCMYVYYECSELNVLPHIMYACILCMYVLVLEKLCSEAWDI